jgi:hypothetical protein
MNFQGHFLIKSSGKSYKIESLLFKKNPQEHLKEKLCCQS